MAKKTKSSLVIAVLLVLIGCITFGGVMTVLNWDFSKLSTGQYEIGNHAINETYENISIIAKTADIVFLPSEDSKTTVVCYEQKNAEHAVAVKDGTLTIEIRDQRKWYEHIGIHFSTPKITLYIPQGQYGALSIRSTTGDIEIPEHFQFHNMDISLSTGDVTNRASALDGIRIETTTGNISLESITASMLDLSVSTGKTNLTSVFCGNTVNLKITTGKTVLTDMKCSSIHSNGSTGDIILKNVIATETMTVSRSTGDITLEGCDAGELSLRTDTGDITGTLLSSKVFIAKTDTGRISVPETVTGGKCTATTDTGSIRLALA